MKTGSFYVMALRADAKTKDLMKFLERVGSCLEVEIPADCGNRDYFSDGIMGIPKRPRSNPMLRGEPRELISGRRIMSLSLAYFL